MKPKKEPDSRSKEFHSKLKDLLTYEQLTFLTTTLLGMSDIMSRFMWLKVKDFIDLPNDVKYAISQSAAIYMLFARIQRGEVNESDKPQFHHMPTDNGAWQSEEDFEQRFLFIVKTFYEQLKKEGKIK